MDRSMNRTLPKKNLPLMVILSIIFFGTFAQAQADQQPEDGTVNARFASMTKEISAVCGTFLPNQIPGVTEYMGLCGGRFGLKIGPNTMLEPQVLAGAGQAQQYILGTLNFRGDVQIDDIIASYYGGADIHYATSPVVNAGAPDSQQTNIYFGADIGGALWWDMTDNLALRADLQFNVNPGTSLFFGVSLVLRFAPQGQETANPTP
jgi:hypothetical protein